MTACVVGMTVEQYSALLAVGCLLVLMGAVQTILMFAARGD